MGTNRKHRYDQKFTEVAKVARRARRMGLNTFIFVSLRWGEMVKRD